MKIVTTYPKVVFLLEIPVNQTPMHTRQYIFHQYNYILQVYFIFLFCQFPDVDGIFLAQGEFFENVKKLLGEVKIIFFWP